MKFNIKTSFVFILLMVFLINTGTYRVSAKNLNHSQEIIRVGYVDINGFFMKEKDSTYAGVGYEMLQEIAMYTGWEYKYIGASLDECLKMLEDGEIDLFLPMQKTSERLKKYEYSKEYISKNQAVVITKPDADYWFNDYDGMNGMTIGTIRGNRNNELLKQYLDPYHCSVVFDDSFESTPELLEALEEGRVDGILATSDRGLSNCKIVLELPEVDSFVIAAKGKTEILDRFDKALEQVKMNTPNIESTLDEKYRDVHFNVKPSFTKEEKEYIENKGTITVLVGNRDYEELNNYDNNKTEDILDQISNLIGLKFKIITEEDTSAVYNSLEDGKADVMFVYNHDYNWAQLHNVWLTNIYAKVPNCVIKKTDTVDIQTVAVIKDSYMHYQLKEKNIKLLLCDTIKEGIEAVIIGKADAVYSNELLANYYSVYPKYSRLSFAASNEYLNEYSMAVSKHSDLEFISIINKAIACIDSSVFELMFVQNINSHNLSLTDFFYSNPIAAIIIMSIMTAMLVLILSLLSFTFVSKKKNIQLEKAYAAKSDFLSHMSHDMRTPMNTIIGLSALSLNGETDVNGMRDYMKKINVSGAYLLGLINDVLDMTKLENEKVVLNLSVVKLDEYYQEIDTIIRQQALDKGIDYRFEVKGCDDQYAKFDKLRVEQIIVNLLSNAIKFTPSGGRVECIIERMIQEDDTNLIRIMIRDNGIGISEAFLPKLFLPFEQEKAEITSKSTGTGLGLSIVKNLVDLMKGTISVTSEKGVGTEFRIELKSERAHGSLDDDKRKPMIPDDFFVGKRILLVEDHPLNTEIAMRLLSAKGFEIQHAENGKIALEMFQESSLNFFDAILMDVRMPVMNGYESARQIRTLKRSDSADVPIIAMTANAFADDIKQAKDAGMNEHLSKPIEPEQMFKILYYYIRRG